VRAFAVIALLVIAGGVVLVVSDASRSDRPATADSVEEVLEGLGCASRQPIQELDAPIRGNAATYGFACRVGGAEVHAFERAPIGDLDDSDKSYAITHGGSLENIHRVVGAGIAPACSWLVVDDRWFLLTDDRQLIEDHADLLGEAVQRVVGASPPYSYVGPGGCAG
jgi:hypothetical protein